MEPIVNEPVALGPPVEDNDKDQNQPVNSILVIPPAIAPLLSLDILKFRQTNDPVEDYLSRCEFGRSYSIFAGDGEQLYKAEERSEYQCCIATEPAEMHIFGVNEQIAFCITRIFSCEGIFCPRCVQTISVYCPPGVLIGTIEQRHSCTTNLLVRDKDGDLIYRIKRPICVYSCTRGNTHFPIFSADQNEFIGEIVKPWKGLVLADATESADDYILTFPTSLNAITKATLSAAVFLIDFLYYQKSGYGGD